MKPDNFGIQWYGDATNQQPQTVEINISSYPGPHGGRIEEENIKISKSKPEILAEPLHTNKGRCQKVSLLCSEHSLTTRLGSR